MSIKNQERIWEEIHQRDETAKKSYRKIFQTEISLKGKKLMANQKEILTKYPSHCFVSENLNTWQLTFVNRTDMQAEFKIFRVKGYNRLIMPLEEKERFLKVFKNKATLNAWQNLREKALLAEANPGFVFLHRTLEQDSSLCHRLKKFLQSKIRDSKTQKEFELSKFRCKLIGSQENYNKLIAKYSNPNFVKRWRKKNICATLNKVSN